MRKKPWSKGVYKQYENYWMEPSPIYQGKWKQKLNTDTLHLEIGAGKGDYWHGIAELHPKRAIVAIERDYTAGSIALRKIEEYENKNKMWIYGDAVDLLDVFAPLEVDVIHLNFSDPWTKKRYHKRRLTFSTQLDKYHEILSENGEIWFKTDNRLLFNDSVIYLDKHDFDLVEFDVDYRKDKHDDPITEYEQKFMDLGQAIYRGVWRKKNVK